MNYGIQLFGKKPLDENQTGQSSLFVPRALELVSREFYTLFGQVRFRSIMYLPSSAHLGTLAHVRAHVSITLVTHITGRHIFSSRECRSLSVFTVDVATMIALSRVCQYVNITGSFIPCLPLVSLQ